MAENTHHLRRLIAGGTVGLLLAASAATAEGLGGLAPVAGRLGTGPSSLLGGGAAADAVRGLPPLGGYAAAPGSRTALGRSHVGRQALPRPRVPSYLDDLTATGRRPFTYQPAAVGEAVPHWHRRADPRRRLHDAYHWHAYRYEYRPPAVAASCRRPVDDGNDHARVRVEDPACEAAIGHR